MRLLSVFMALLVLGPWAAGDAVCAAPQGAKAAGAQWRVDHYVFDASLRRDWKVLVDCRHPDAPARMELLPAAARERVGDGRPGTMQAANGEDAEPKDAHDFVVPALVKAGETVNVASDAGGPVRISMRGIAMQTAFFGQKIRVRLNVNGRFVSGVVRGPHQIELSVVARPWGKP